MGHYINRCCYLIKIPKEVDLIIPIRNIYLVEKPTSKPITSSSDDEEHTAQRSLIITTKDKENFLFSSLFERDMILQKISDMILSNQECSL